MIKQDAWIAFIFFLIALLAGAILLQACFSHDHVDIPDKHDVRIVPTPEPTPEKSACEYEVDELRDELEHVRNGYECICSDVD
jgi:hypothetical protein